MAEGFANENGWSAFSAGTKPEVAVNPFAIRAMQEVGIDISMHVPQKVDEYLQEDFYVVATVCDNAKASCPVFSGNCTHILHNGFLDPANTIGSDEEILKIYQKVRDEIQVWMKKITAEYLL